MIWGQAEVSRASDGVPFHNDPLAIPPCHPSLPSLPAIPPCHPSLPSPSCVPDGPWSHDCWDWAFLAWCEARWQEETSPETASETAPIAFAPAAVTTPTITAYRAFLQTTHGLRPASINRALISLKRYFAWTVDAGLIVRDPAKVVKLVEQVDPPPRFLSDREEDALVAAVSRHGTLRDRIVLLLLLHTGLRARDLPPAPATGASGLTEWNA
jgi:hypothetical protein